MNPRAVPASLWVLPVLGVTLVALVSACPPVHPVRRFGIPPPVYVVTVPPPPRPATALAEPAPRAGSVWVEGHWKWAGNQWDWQEGYWMDAMPGHQWVPGRWVVRGPAVWAYIPGWWRPGDRPPPRIAYPRYRPPDVYYSTARTDHHEHGHHHPHPAGGHHHHPHGHPHYGGPSDHHHPF
jgi:hypothetical protein